MTRDKLMEVLSLLNPASAAALTLAGVTDEHLEFAVFHEAAHIYEAREAKNSETTRQINITLKKD